MATLYKNGKELVRARKIHKTENGERLTIWSFRDNGWILTKWKINEFDFKHDYGWKRKQKYKPMPIDQIKQILTQKGFVIIN